MKLSSLGAPLGRFWLPFGDLGGRQRGSKNRTFWHHVGKKDGKMTSKSSQKNLVGGRLGFYTRLTSLWRILCHFGHKLGAKGGPKIALFGTMLEKMVEK